MTCIRCNCPSYFETYCILDAAHGPMQFAVSQLGIGNTKRLAEGFHATSQWTIMMYSYEYGAYINIKYQAHIAHPWIFSNIATAITVHLPVKDVYCRAGVAKGKHGLFWCFLCCVMLSCTCAVDFTLILNFIWYLYVWGLSLLQRNRWQCFYSKKWLWTLIPPKPPRLAR